MYSSFFNVNTFLKVKKVNERIIFNVLILYATMSMASKSHDSRLKNTW